MSLTDVPILADEDGVTEPYFCDLNIKLGSLGKGSLVSLHNMKTTSDMVGLSSTNDCTHKRPMWMHLKTSQASYESPNNGSATSKALSFFQESHT